FHAHPLLPHDNLQGQVDLVAANLSMLGFFVEEFPRIRPESLAALDAALLRLEAEQDLLGADSRGKTAHLPQADEPSGSVLAEEVLANIAQHLQALRVNNTDHDALIEVRRGYHTLKGSGRTVGLGEMGAVAWAVEKLLNFILESDIVPDGSQLAFVEKASAAF